MLCPQCAESIPTAAKRCSHCHSDLDQTTGRRRFFKRARKGIWVLLSIVGTALLTTWIVPLIVDRVNHQKTLYEARVRIAEQVIENGNATETRLDDLETILAIFPQDARELSPAQFREEQPQAPSRLTAPYFEFTRIGWWWFGKTQREADFPKPLTDDRQKELRRLADEYDKALYQSTIALTAEWDAVLPDGAP